MREATCFSLCTIFWLYGGRPVMNDKTLYVERARPSKFLVVVLCCLRVSSENLQSLFTIFVRKCKLTTAKPNGAPYLNACFLVATHRARHTS
jgi:hypothetical protein